MCRASNAAQSANASAQAYAPDVIISNYSQRSNINGGKHSSNLCVYGGIIAGSRGYVTN